MQLLHEVEVRCYIRLAVSDQSESVVEAQVQFVHEVCHGDGDRATDTCETVHKDSFGAVPAFICKPAVACYYLFFSN